MCPEVFEVVDGAARVRVPRVKAAAEYFCREAARACPGDSITLQRQLFAP
jgi:ferredoxin